MYFRSMIKFEKFQLGNGLRVIVHTDRTTPMVAVNVLYNVGARDEDGDKTGFAHLFEHLMFGGSANIPDYDEPLQMAGGENNAYTTNDITNYYIQLPSQNIETAFWLESDRMNELAFSIKSLDVQKKVVCEEFKEHYINKPYGDVWKYMRELCYTKHPYRWMTIGKELSHIEQASLDDVKAFFYKYYRPSNAVLCVAGNVSYDEVVRLAEKWFGSIPSGNIYLRNLPKEPIQKEARFLQMERDVPVSLVIKAYPIADRMSQDYYVADLITEILSGGQSSRLHQRLVKEQMLFSQIDCYHTGSVENGLLVIEGKVLPTIRPEQADAAIVKELEEVMSVRVSEKELEKVKNKVESMLAFEDLNLLNRANNLAFYELLGDASLMNQEFANYDKVSADDIMHYGAKILHPSNSNTMYYLSKSASAT